jgi:hypothetical protein
VYIRLRFQFAVSPTLTSLFASPCQFFTVLRPLQFSFRKRSEAALIVHVTEHRGRPSRARESTEGATAEHGRSAGGAPGSAPEHWASAALMPIRRGQFGLRGPPLGLGCSCPLYPSFVSAKPAAWKLRSFPLRGDASCPTLVAE